MTQTIEKIETIKRDQILDTINRNPNHIFAMTYIKADGSLREATCRLHVQNPQHTLKPGTGLYAGESFEHAYNVNGNIKYFDMGVEGDGGKGGFRTAKIARIQTVTVDGHTYHVVD